MKKILALILVLMLFCLSVPAMAAEKTVFKLDSANKQVFVGETVQMALIRQGAAEAEGTVTYSSSNEKRASVDANGLVTGLSRGQVTITARLKTDSKTYKATLTVTVAVRADEISVSEDKLTVYAAEDPFVAPLLSADASDASLPVLLLRKGSQQTVSATVLPKEAANRKVTLTVSNEEVVKVKGNVLTPKAPGECVLTIASVQNPEIVKKYRLLVIQPVTKLVVSAEEKSLYVGETLALTADYTPDNASVKDAVWSSGSEKIASVDAWGVVTGRSKGTVTIKAAAADGSGRYGTLKLTVKQQPESITLKESSIVVNVGKQKSLTATVLPASTNDKSKVWTSSDESVAKVNGKGQVTGVAPGVCTITCASKDFPGVYTTASVEVRQPVTKVAFADTSVTFNVGDTCQLFWQTSPANATNPAVTFKTNNSKVATVDADGLLTGHKRGSCTITVTAADGSGKKDTVKVNVLQPVLGVHMENDTLRVGVDERYTARAVMEPEDASNTNMTWYTADPTIATVKGTKNRPVITGHRWGTTTITGVTEDGGYTTAATVNVGNYDKALKITDLYLQDNKIKIVVNNESNMTVTRFSFVIECYDIYNAPLICNENYTHAFYGTYNLTLYEGDNTRHGRFTFNDFIQPAPQIGRVVMRITGYSTDTGYSRDIRSSRQVAMEYVSPSYIGETPTPVPVVTPEPLP
ncbi:MAG: Ig-like domain-containing protein [Clostridia bacterium]|nr:Ig-like domain-containing protein [Clostridia bacterium]